MRTDDELKCRGWFKLADMMVHPNEGSGIDSVYPTDDEVKTISNSWELSGSENMKYQLTHNPISIIVHRMRQGYGEVGITQTE